jgi:hypothetical protein
MTQYTQVASRLKQPPNTDDVMVLRNYVKDLANIVGLISKNLDDIINGNLDANNIRTNSIEAKNLKAGSITTDKIQAGSITSDLIANDAIISQLIASGAVTQDEIADAAVVASKIAAGAVIAAKIAAGAVTADKIDVNQLSAIAADLGTVTAGIIYGAYIATSNGTYPRIELSSVNRLLTAFSDALHYVSINPTTGSGPGISWTDGGVLGAYLAFVSGYGILFSTVGSTNNMRFSPAGNLDLSPGGDLSIGTLSGITGAVYVATTPGGPANTAINFSKGIRTI